MAVFSLVLDWDDIEDFLVIRPLVTFNGPATYAVAVAEVEVEVEAAAFALARVCGVILSKILMMWLLGLNRLR